jgi:hypothetical protein
MFKSNPVQHIIMKKRICQGTIRFCDGSTSEATCVIINNHPHKWLESRANLILPASVGNLPCGENKLWRVGVFICTKDDHVHHNDNVYSLSAVGMGEIIKEEDKKQESIFIKVRALKISSPIKDESKPRVRSLE